MIPLRPHEMIWNFIYEENKNNKAPRHCVRPDASPHKCYIDGRIEKLFELIDHIAGLIKEFDAERWTKLNEHVLNIFKVKEQEDEQAYQAFSSSEQ